MTGSARFAPGWPGIEPRWTSSTKCAVGAPCVDGSQIWFTASHGILNEIYYPELDTACTRDLGFIVTDDHGFFSEEKRHTTHGVEWAAPGIPAYRLFNRCPAERFSIEKRICASPTFDAVLQQVAFTPHHGALEAHRLTVLLSAHLGNYGSGNTAWRGDYKGTPMLFAQRNELSLALASTAPWLAQTVGFAGPEDPWHDLRDNGRLTREFDRAENGNVVLAATIDLAACAGRFTLAVAFGPDPMTAALHARMALIDPYEINEARYIAPWQAFQRGLSPLDEVASASEPHLYRTSTAVLKSHASMRCDGGIIASLSVPWGSSKGDGDLGGYHLVWPRDMVSSAGALLAAGAHEEVLASLRYLVATQDADGHWGQNFWLNGAPYWTGVQLDETAFPILLADLARRDGLLDADHLARVWPMVQRAAAFLVQHGPVTQQDRWEEEAGFSPFTLGATIAALLAAADMADLHGDARGATYLRETADDWNERIEEWTYVEDGPLAERVGVAGYYVRIGTPVATDGAPPPRGELMINNRVAGEAVHSASAIVATDALALVRFGLRDAHDRRIRDTVTVIDAVLRTDTNTGPVWHRYNEDGYGEQADGGPFDGVGIGRGWPLLAGERAHYELLAGDVEGAERLAAVMRSQAGPGGMLPEQVWDAADIPELELFNGRHTGSAMPLAWAHAEYVKLLRSLRDGTVFDRPPQTVARYIDTITVPGTTSWRLAVPCSALAAGRQLRLEVAEPARVRWSADAWQTVTDHFTSANEYGVHLVDLPTQSLAAGATIRFTFEWIRDARWEGRDFSLAVV
jgi:glucoamylase